MKRQKYASDISREKFAEIEAELRKVRRTTKPVTLDLYEVFCAILYLLRTGCQWRFLPTRLPQMAKCLCLLEQMEQARRTWHECLGAGT